MPNRAAALTWEQLEPHSTSGSARERILLAALRIADSDGLEAASIRRVASELSMRPMSIYSYVASKEDLLDLMVNQVVGEVVLEQMPATDWRSAVRAIADRSHTTFLKHPWILQASGPTRRVGPNTLRHAEQLLDALAPLGLTARDAWAAASTVNDYTLGHAQRLLNAAGVPAERYPNLDPAAFPHLSAALGDGAHSRDESTFHSGLSTVLDGIALRHATTADDDDDELPA